MKDSDESKQKCSNIGSYNEIELRAYVNGIKEHLDSFVDNECPYFLYGREIAKNKNNDLSVKSMHKYLQNKKQEKKDFNW